MMLILQNANFLVGSFQILLTINSVFLTIKIYSDLSYEKDLKKISFIDEMVLNDD
jgi:hypothetical protein